MRTRLLTIALAAATALAFSPTAAHADIRNGDLKIATRVTDPKVVVTSGSCRHVPIATDYSAYSDVETISLDIEVWRGSTNVGSASLFGADGARSGRVEGSYYYCPYEGLGSFHIGPSEITWFDSNYNERTITDEETDSFTVRQGSRLRTVSAGRKGSVRTFTARAQYFDVELRRWKAVPKGAKVALQRQATSTRSWRTIKTARAGKKGALRVSTKASKTGRYRLTLTNTSRTWGATSGTMRK